MKVWKWTALMMSGAVLLQLGSCVVTVAQILFQEAGNQLLTSLLTQIAGTAAGT